MTIWSFLRQLEIFYGHLVYFVVIWYICPRFGILGQEKSGNPEEKEPTIIFFTNVLARVSESRSCLDCSSENVGLEDFDTNYTYLRT
jgi:hypothetical protein